MIHVKKLPFHFCAGAEHFADSSSWSQIIWITQMLSEHNVTHDVMTLHYDNLGIINIFKHIGISHHLIRERVEEKTINLEHVATKLLLADILTKDLDTIQFEDLRGKLGICQHEKL